MTRSLLAASLVAAAIVLPGAAVASDSFDVRGRNVVTDTVNVGDLDLSSKWGMNQLIKRLRGRIDDMCEWDASCRDEAWLSADWQVARVAERDIWRKRIAYERQYDRRIMVVRRAGPAPSTFDEGPPEVTYDPPQYEQPRGVPVSRTVTTKTQTFTIKTTTVTLTYRMPPPDYRATWTPRR